MKIAETWIPGSGSTPKCQQTPRQLLYYIIFLPGSDARNPSIKSDADSSSFAPSKMEVLRSKLKTVAPTRGSGEFGDAAVVAASLHTVRDQLKYLKSAVESSLELSKKKQSGGGGGAVVPPDHEAAVVEADLQVGPIGVGDHITS
jgi:hypothetical protein